MFSKMKKIAFFATLMSLLFASQAQKPKQQPAAKTRTTARVETLSADAFARRIAAGGIVLVDVRSPKEYAEGHLKGAVNVAWGDQFDSLWQAAAIGKGQPIAVYCRGGRRSKAAATALVKKGYTVINLDGGIMAWTKAGKPVVK